MDGGDYNIPFAFFKKRGDYKANSFDTEATFFDLGLSITNGIHVVSSKFVINRIILILIL